MAIKNGKKLGALVERYGMADEAEKQAKKDKAEARAEIEKLLKVGEEARSTHFIISVSEKVNRVLDNVKVMKAVGSKTYALISTVGIGKLTEIVGAQGVDEMTESFKPVVTFNVKRHK